MAGTTWADILKRIGEEIKNLKDKHPVTRKEIIAKKLYELAAGGDIKAATAIMDREEGKPAQTQIITGGEEERPVRLTIDDRTDHNKTKSKTDRSMEDSKK